MTTEQTSVPEGHTLIRVSSHRATDKLKRVLGDDLQWFYSFADGNNFVACPDAKIADAVAITGITRARPKERLWRCWSFI